MKKQVLTNLHEVKTMESKLLGNGMTQEEWKKELARIKMIKLRNGELH